MQLQETMNKAEINLPCKHEKLAETPCCKAASRAANTPTAKRLAEQLRQSKQEAFNGQQGRVPMPVQISDV